MAKKEETSKTVAKSASKVLSSPKSSKAEKTAAASALSQHKQPAKQTSSKAASAAAKVLNNPSSSGAAKKAAASVLTQKSGSGTGSGGPRTKSKK